MGPRDLFLCGKYAQLCPGKKSKVGKYKNEKPFLPPVQAGQNFYRRFIPKDRAIERRIGIHRSTRKIGLEKSENLTKCEKMVTICSFREIDIDFEAKRVFHCMGVESAQTRP